MRKNLGPKSLICPEPVLIIATYNEDGSANAMNAAWGGVSDYNEIIISVSKHKTTENIKKTKAFTVSFATKEQVVSCDYVGIVTGNKVKDKLNKAKWHISKSENVNAPLIDELPVALECKLKKYDEKAGHLIGTIVNVSVDSSVLTRGKVDYKKFHPIIFDGLNNTYMSLGDKVANAFSIGKKLIK